MKYPGKELEVFDKAIVFQKYTYFIIKKYFKGKSFEVGAGLGAFTRNYINKKRKIYLNDLDPYNYKFLKKKYAAYKNIIITKKKLQNINTKFDTIIYLNVLEHIFKDKIEIIKASEKMKKGGYLIFLVPAHQELYTKFDKAIGHYRRYDLKFFKSNNFKNLKLKKLIYLDMVGYFLYFLNKFFFKEEVYPSPFKIFLWDKVFTPITIVLDFLTNYKFGKNVLCVYKKSS